MKKLSAILNSLLIGAMLWIALALLARSFLARTPTVIVATAISLTATVIGLVLALGSKEVRINAPAARRVRKALLLFSHARRVEFFGGLFCLRAPTSVDQGSVVTEYNGTDRCVTDAVRFAPLTPDDVVQAHASTTLPCLILCDSASAEATELARELDVVILDYSAQWSMMQELRAYPHTAAAPKKSRARSLGALLLDRRRVRSYLVSALILAVSSLWSGMRTYYLVASVIACILAFACAVLPRRALNTDG